MALVLWLIRRILRSDLGTSFRAVQNDEVAAASMGIPVIRVRVAAFVITGAMAGLAGSLYGHYLLLITPHILSLDLMFLVLAMTVIGGIGTFIGPIVGALFLEALSEYIRRYGEFHVLIFGLVALVVARFAPEGLVGLLSRWLRRSIGEGLMSLLRVESLNKRFGGLLAVSQASFEVKEGEIVGLIGPNGAGKTTLFNLITGAITADSGRITFDGQDLKGLSSYQICRAGIARTFQVPRPFAKMTCSENVLVALIGRNISVPQPERPGTIREMLELVGLAGKERVLSADLNLIDTKRLEVARALATGPRLILLDEVLGGLSSLEMSQALDLIRAIRDRFGVTVLWIEHVMGAIMSLSERVLVLNQGRLICEGAPAEVTRDKRVIEAYLGEPDAQD